MVSLCYRTHANGALVCVGILRHAFMLCDRRLSSVVCSVPATVPCSLNASSAVHAVLPAACDTGAANKRSLERCIVLDLFVLNARGFHVR